MKKTKRQKAQTVQVNDCAISRRNFLKLSTISSGGVLASSCGILKLIISDTNDYWMHCKYQDIKIVTRTHREIYDVIKTIGYLNEMPSKLKKRFGIEYNEPKRVLDVFRASKTPIIEVDKDHTESTGAGASYINDHENYKALIIDTDNTSEKDYANLATNTYHELIHVEQDDHNTYPPTGYSNNDAARIMLEAERLANASNAEFNALSTILTIDSHLSLKELAIKAKEKIQADIIQFEMATMRINEIEERTQTKISTDKQMEIIKSYGVLHAHYSLTASIAALDEIIKKGPDAVKNLDTKKAAFETLCGDGIDAIDFTLTYEEQVTDDYYEKHIFPDAGKTPDQPLDDIINKLHSFDGRGPIYPQNAVNHPLHQTNTNIFDKYIRKNNPYSEHTPTTSLTPDPETLQSPVKEVIDRTFSFAQRFLDKKSGKC
ncbi:MAG: hypothetical protein GY804_04740 [Alphaproteobacteria bacterium]|nr:hypothetical protein [Alphaproteobacteria bacterium]